MKTKPTYQDLEQELEVLKSKETTLINDEKYFKNYVENNPNIIFTINSEGNILYMNHSPKGVTLKQVIGKSMYSFMNVNYHELVKEKVNDIFKEGKPNQYETKGIGPNGKEAYYLSNIGPVFDTKNKIKAAIICTQDISEFKKTEENLTNAINIIERSPSVVFLWKNEENWPVEYVSKNVQQLFGYSEEDFLSCKISYGELIHPDDDALVTEEVTNFSNNNSTSYTHKPYRIITKTGNIKWVKDTTQIIRNEKGEITHYEGILLDITKSIKAEQELRKLNLAIENSINEVFIFNAETLKFSFINKGALNNLGYTLEELKLMSPIDIKPEFTLQSFLKKVSPLKNGKVKKLQLETIHQRKDKTTYPVEINLSKFSVQGNEHFLALIIDITERKKVKDALIESENKFKTIIENAGDAMYMANFKGEILKGNKLACETLGYTEKELLRLNITELDADFVDIEKAKKFWKTLEIGKPYTIETNHKRKDGSIFPVEIKIGIATINNEKVTLGFARDITDRKASEIKIKESESNFKAFTNQSSEGISVADLKGNYTYVNPAFCKMMGYTETELLTMTVFDVTADKKDKETFKKTTTVEEGNPVSVTLIRKNGTEFIAEVIGKKLIINNEKRVLGTIRDITERKVAEKKLKDSEHLLKEAQKVAKIGHWELNLVENKLNWSDEVFRIFNSKPQEFKPTYATFLEKTHPKDRDKVNNAYLDSLSNKKPYEITHRLLLNSNKIKYVLEKCVTEFNEEGKPLRSLGTIQDISERKQEELKLAKSRDEVKESERKFRNLYEKSGDAIMINVNSKVVEFNEATVKMFGYTSKKDFLNIHPSDVSPKLQPDGSNSYEKAEEMLKIASKNGTHRFEWTHKKRNGETFPTEVLLTSISNKENNNINHAVVRDITDRKRIEVELIEAKKKAEESDRLKTEFISNMSHEIRTPMNGIMGFSELLADPDLIDDKRKYFVQIIKNSGKQLLQIIDDIIEISKLGTKQVKVYEEPVNLNDLFLELFSIFDKKAKENNTPLYLNKGLSDKQSTILIDKSKLNKILSNLLENALKFTNIGSIEFGYNLKNKNETPILEIYVKDTGVGIKPEDQKLIFERFVRAGKETTKKVKGLGLGLSIAKENTTLLGGEITVESTKGNGTTFFITIPYKPVFDEVEISNETLQKKQTILIVEDEEVNYLYLDTLINDVLKINCIILHAKNGQEAIDICKKNTTIDFILMDLKMPVMNGYESAKEIKKMYPSIPIIAQTAYSRKEEQEKAAIAGCDDFISKPISKDSLFNIINKFVPQI